MLQKFSAGLGLFLLASFAYAEQGFHSCRHFFVNQTPPTNYTVVKGRDLCFSEFAVLHSGLTKTPIFVAQRLNRKGVSAKIKRTNHFFSDARLPRSERAELEDYKNSGYDRGHLAPAADMASNEGMAQCFSLANMVPQDRFNNQKVWSKVETATRRYVSRAQGDVYVITGAVFSNGSEKIGRNQVWVPRSLYKLIYDPARKKSWAYWVDNSPDAKINAPITYEELVKRTGIQFFPKEIS